MTLSEFEITTGGTWHTRGCGSCGSQCEHDWRVSSAASAHDAPTAVEAVFTEARRLVGRPLIHFAPRDESSHVQPMITFVTDDGGSFTFFRFETFLATQPETYHVRTLIRTPRQNG